VVEIPHRKQHKAVETGYYVATDIGKQHRNLWFSHKLIFEVLNAAKEESIN
jgi:hypothetical protein